MIFYVIIPFNVREYVRLSSSEMVKPVLAAKKRVNGKVDMRIEWWWDVARIQSWHTGKYA